jgi:hypothetical protein
MLEYVLDALTQDKVTYLYYPEGDRSCPGTVSIDLATGEWTVDSRSKRDPYGTYAGHALDAVASFKEDHLRESGIVAWC